MGFTLLFGLVEIILFACEGPGEKGVPLYTAAMLSQYIVLLYRVKSMHQLHYYNILNYFPENLSETNLKFLTQGLDFIIRMLIIVLLL